MAIRFHLDENVSSAVASSLRQRGVDVTTAYEAELLGRDDRDHLEFANSQSRVVVTHDDDFTRIHAEGSQHSGICFCRKEKHSIGDLVRILLLIRECFSESEMRGHLEYL